VERLLEIENDAAIELAPVTFDLGADSLFVLSQDDGDGGDMIVMSRSMLRKLKEFMVSEGF